MCTTLKPHLHGFTRAYIYNVAGLQLSRLVVGIIIAVGNDDVVEKVQSHDVAGVLQALRQVVVAFAGREAS